MFHHNCHFSAQSANSHDVKSTCKVKYLQSTCKYLKYFGSSTSTSTNTSLFQNPSTSTSTSTPYPVPRYKYQVQVQYLTPSLFIIPCSINLPEHVWVIKNLIPSFLPL